MSDETKTLPLCPLLSPVVQGPLGKPAIMGVECVGERCAWYKPCQVLPAKIEAFVTAARFEQ